MCGAFNIDLLHCEVQTEWKRFLEQMYLIVRTTRITGTTATIPYNIFCSELGRNKKCAALFFPLCVITVLMWLIIMIQ